MKTEINERPLAKQDIMGIAKYLTLEDDALGYRFIEAVYDDFDWLSQMPYSGSLWEPGETQFPGVRYWPVRDFKNHLIFFRPTERGIEVFRVLHGARDLENLPLI